MSIEIKWGILFSAMMLLWMLLEKSLGLHDELIEKHHMYTNFVAIPAIAFYFMALVDKRKNYYEGVMTYKQGLRTGVIISLVVMILSPATQLITALYITPNYFTNAIAFAVENKHMTQDEAENYFNLSNYTIQSTIYSPIMGIITAAILALIVKRKAKID